MRSVTVVRVLLAFAAVSAGMVGAWAMLAPRSFYDNFPGSGHHWVAVDGPFNEHLVRDVGELNVALLVVLVAAFVWMTRPLLITAALAVIAYYVPHLVYHAAHTDLYSTSDAVAELGGLASNAVVALVVLFLVLRPTAERAQATT